ncbi:MAG TPA: hypothetical protein VKF17_16710 [Isosphaeraceae bacterium]|nr:hypothetical protein [Isosphaeraceae bacterium]
MSLSETEIARVISDRFVRWEKFFLRKRATPILVLGVTADPPPRPVITICQGIPDRQIQELLIAALTLMGDRQLGDDDE